MSGSVYTIEVLPSVDLDVAEYRAFLDTCRVGLGTNWKAKSGRFLLSYGTIHESFSAGTASFAWCRPSDCVTK